MLSKYCTFLNRDYHMRTSHRLLPTRFALLWNAYLWSEPQWLELIPILSLMLEEKLFEQVELT